MADPRAAILGAIRAALGANAGDAAAIAREGAALLDDPDLVRPALAAVDLAACFAARASHPLIGATVERVRRLADLPAAVRRYAGAQAVARVAVQPCAALRALDWRGLQIHADIAADEPIAVGLAEWGVAETGSVVFRSGPETPVLFHFLPLHHIVALRAANIVAHLEELAAALARAGPPPRNVNIVTGASGTTDIEGSYVGGAHGPGFLHIVLVME